MFLKQLCDISKDNIRKIISEIKIKKKVSELTLKKADFSLCPDSCEYKSKKSVKACNGINCSLINLKIVDNICEYENLSKDSLIEERFLQNPILGDKETIKLSKFQILEFIALHFLLKRKDGLIQNISFSELANLLGCSLNTVSYNSYVLCELGMISIEKKDIDTYDIKIIGYENYFNNKEEGGSGYITLTKVFLLNLLSLKKEDFSINVIRLALKELLEYDNKRINKIFAVNEDEKDYTNEKTIKEIRNFLPKRFHKKTILDIFNILKKANIFIINIKDRIISLKPTKSTNGYMFAIENYEEFSKAIMKKVETINELLKSNIKLSKDNSEKIIKLTNYFGLKHVENVLDSFIKSEDIRNSVTSAEDITLYVRQSLNKIS